MHEVYGWIHVHSVLDKDHDGSISAEEIAAFVMEAVMTAAFFGNDGTLHRMDPVVALMSVPDNMRNKTGGCLGTVGLLGWLVAMMAGADARQVVLDLNFLVVPWVMMPMSLIILVLAGKISVAFVEFTEKSAKMF